MADGRQQAGLAALRSETGAIETADQVDDWIAIDRDGSVRVNSGKVELGTGVRTSLAQIACEELDVAFESVRMEMGRTGETPDEGYTAGSKTIRFGGFSIRHAAAEARQAILELASERLGVVVRELGTRDGSVFVTADPRRRLSYAELVGGRKFDRRIGGRAATKSPSDYRLVGTDVPRTELPGKFMGAGSYIHDLRLPGMVHARVVRPPSAGAELVSLDEESAGTARVVRLGSFVAVVAEREETAIEAARALQVEWRETRTLPRPEEIHDELKKITSTEEEIVTQGDASQAFARESGTVEATYLQPYQAHASIGPSCAVARMEDGVMTVWCATQGVYPLRGAIADLLGMAPESVKLVHVEGAGCYGHNGADDVAADAALIAHETGETVRVQWSREDEFAWEPYGPAMVMELRGAVGEDGRVAAWKNETWTPSHVTRGRTAGGLVAGQLTGDHQPPAKKLFIGGNRNAPTNYDFPNQRVVMHWLDHGHLRTSALRSLGAFANTFANESFVDELAHTAGADPVEFRLHHLADARARDVLSAAAQAADWGAALPDGEGRGVAFARYENEEAYVATVAHVRVDPSSGAIRALKITVAHDCGLIINPNGLKNQIEGNVVQSLSRALYEQVSWQGSRVTSLDWSSYRIIKFSEVPAVEIVLINRPEEPAMGAGEPATITTAPAVANAVFAACGARLRRVPFLPAQVKGLLEK